MQLFAGAQPGIDNLDIIPLRPADQKPCNIGDLHRRAHVQHQSFTAAPYGSGLQHQLTRLWNRHEEPSDVGMSDRYRTALFDLPRERFQYRATRSEYVAETNTEKSPIHTTGHISRQAFR